MTGDYAVQSREVFPAVAGRRVVRAGHGESAQRPFVPGGAPSSRFFESIESGYAASRGVE